MFASLYAKLAVIAVVALVSFGAGVKVEQWHRDSLDLKIAQAAQKAVDAEAKHQNDSSAQLEEKKVEIQTVTQTVTKYVDRIVTRQIYTNRCLDDDGLQYANAALAGTPPAAGQPDAAVPGPHAHGGRHGSLGTAQAGGGQRPIS